MQSSRDAATLPPRAKPATRRPDRAARIPWYLQRYYWWAYVHPRAVRFLDRHWIVNAILWGNFARLRDGALDELGSTIHGRTLQIACVYGNFTPRLASRLEPTASLDVADVVLLQLQNLARKVAPDVRINLHNRDATKLGLPVSCYDQAIIFFLLHEQPAEVRRQTLAEALRVVKLTGKLVIVDYHRPSRWHPLRYLFRPLLRRVEPFALDLWQNDICDWLPAGPGQFNIRKQTFFGGLYQMLVISPNAPAPARAGERSRA